MAISKLILNGETQMDVTSNTNTSNNMLSGVIGTKNDGTSVTGNIASKSSSDLTVSGATVTAPAGYYSTAATKSIGAGSAFPPAVTITKAPTIGVNTSGVVTASYNGSSSITPTVNAGYVSQGMAVTISTTGTSTYQLTSKAAATYYPSTADQMIASQRWLVGNQTIKSVTTSNLTAANIAEGVTVQVGDSANASRITQITGTYSSGSKHTAVITSKTAYRSNIYYNDVEYYVNQPFEFSAGDVCVIQVYGEMGPATIRENGIKIGESNAGNTYKYFYVLPDCDIEISTSPNGYSAYVDIVFAGDIQSVKNVSINQNGTFTLLPDNTINIIKNSTYTTSTPSGFKYSVPELSQLVVGETYKLAISFRDDGRPLTGAYYNDNFIFNGYYEDTGTDTIQFSIDNYPLSVRLYRTLTVDGISGYGIYVSGSSNDSGTGSLHMKISKATAMATVSASVNVQGGFTADQIATYAISGNISGDATTIQGYAFYNCSYLTAASFPTCSSIGSYAFYFASRLTTVSFPSCKSIGSHAFEYCGSLTSVTFPMCSIINSCAFSYCEGLTTVSFPSCKSIGYSAFYYCSVLSTISFPLCTTISDGAFMYCRSLTSVNFPSCIEVGLSAFYGCYNLSIISFPVCKNIQGDAFPGTKITEANFPNVSKIAYYAFSGCSSLITANFPSCTTIQSNAFAGCSVLFTISFPLCASISSYAFQSCYNLLSVYLLGSSVPKLANANAFYKTPISDYTTSTGGVYGSIFVPSSLYNSYLTATNWSLYSDRIVSV